MSNEEALSMLVADAAAIAASADTSTLKPLVTHYQWLQDRIAKGEALLKQLQETSRTLREVQIPEAMRELGVSRAQMDDGTTVTLQETIHASLSEAKKPAAYAWLREHGYDEVIKTQLILRFGKGADEQRALAEEALHALIEQDIIETYETKSDVHSSTFKALVRELLREGVSLPLDTLGVYLRSEAVVK